MILIGLGGNLPTSLGGPVAACEAALARLEEAGVKVLTRSPWYETAPIPVSDQPWFINGVAQVSTPREPAELLDLLHRIEGDLGRVRSVPNAARAVDLDLLAYNERVQSVGSPVLPHPRLQDRAFVLLPLRNIAPAWRHPVTGATLDEMIAAMPPGQQIRLKALSGGAIPRK